MEDIKWFDWKNAWPVDELTKEQWIHELLGPKAEHMRANFILSGDTMVLLLHNGNDLEIFELKPVRSAYIKGAGRETTEYPGAVFKKPE